MWTAILLAPNKTVPRGGLRCRPVVYVLGREKGISLKRSVHRLDMWRQQCRFLQRQAPAEWLENPVKRAGQKPRTDPGVVDKWCPDKLRVVRWHLDHKVSYGQGQQFLDTQIEKFEFAQECPAADYAALAVLVERTDGPAPARTPTLALALIAAPTRPLAVAGPAIYRLAFAGSLVLALAHRFVNAVGFAV